MPLAPLHAPNAWSQAAPEQRLHTLRLDAPCISDVMPQKSAHAPAESRRPGLVQARRPYAVTEPPLRPPNRRSTGFPLLAFPFGNADDDGEKKEIIFKCVDGKWIPAFLDFSDETTARLKNAISSVKFTDAQRGAVLTLLRSLTNSANEFGKAENRHMLKSIAEQQKMPIIMAFMLMGSAFSSGDGEGLPANFSLPF